MKERYIIAMVGHTAAGKTTLAKYLSQKLDIPYVSEGEFKRRLKSHYISENSMDEMLRDKGYALAISCCVGLLDSNNIVIIDASFHKLLRRMWLFDAVKNLPNTHIIWLHCNCPNEAEVKERLQRRAQSIEKNADNQADQFYIYEYIKATFDLLDIEDFPSSIGSAVVEINTEENLISETRKNKLCNQRLLQILISSILPEYLSSKQCILSGGKHG